MGMRRASLGKKILVGAGVVVALAVVWLYTTSSGKAARDIAGSGVIQDAISKPERRQYDPSDTDKNLHELALALKQYEASEGQYPEGDKWMDQIGRNLILNDLPKKEAEKKLMRPGVAEGEYGYALNDKVAGRYKGDLPKGTILLFESKSTARNAHGDPKRDAIPGAHAVTIEEAPAKP